MNEGVSRTDHDSMGPIQVPADRYRGPQTQRSIEHFPVGRDGFVFGRPMIEALGLVKRAAATVNEELGLLEPRLAEAIRRAADEVVAGRLDDHFPVVVFQTGSGTQSNMNANEVIANRAIELLGGRGAPKTRSTATITSTWVSRRTTCSRRRCTWPRVVMLDRRLYPPVQQLPRPATPRRRRSTTSSRLLTHLQDATPITLGRDWRLVAQITDAVDGIRTNADGLRRLAIGGTAVGTGLNTHPEFAVQRQPD